LKRSTPADLDPSQYQKLEDFRFRIRRFLNFSEAAARASGLEPQQHQALLVLKATPRGQAPTIGYLAGRLLLKHHSAVGLVDRLESLGLVRRATAREDARQVLIRLTVYGNRVLRRLSLAHRIELEQTGPALAAALRGIGRKKHS